MSRQDDIRDMLSQFSRALEESNQELLDEVRMEIIQLRQEIAEVRAELRVARAEAALALEGASQRTAATVPESAPAEPDLPQADPSRELQEELRQRHEEIWRLLSTGEDVAEVSRRTNRPVGEIELIKRLIGPKPGMSARRGR